MILKLYTTTEKPNTINKKLTFIKDITGNAIEPINIIKPNIKIKVDDTLLACNYIYIAKFKRYYFLKNIVIQSGFMNIELEVDVLESHKEDILAYNGILARSEFDYNLNLEDNEISAYSKELIQVKTFPYQAFLPTIDEEEKRIVMITI